MRKYSELLATALAASQVTTIFATASDKSEFRGDLYSKRGNYQSALEDYQTALTVYPEKKDQLERKINQISEIFGAEPEKTCWTDYVNGNVAKSCKAALSEDYSIAPKKHL